MVQIIRVGERDGDKVYAWFPEVAGQKEAEEKFIELYGDTPDHSFNYMDGVGCGPLDVNRDYGGHA